MHRLTVEFHGLLNIALLARCSCLRRDLVETRLIFLGECAIGDQEKWKKKKKRSQRKQAPLTQSPMFHEIHGDFSTLPRPHPSWKWPRMGIHRAGAPFKPHFGLNGAWCQPLKVSRQKTNLTPASPAIHSSTPPPPAHPPGS